MQLAHLTWHQAEPILRRPDTIVAIPVGSTEQHGPIGPLGTDWLIPEWITKEMEKHVDLLVAPVLPFSVATHHTSFPGTIDLGLDTMTNVMRGVFESLARHGGESFSHRQRPRREQPGDRTRRPRSRPRDARPRPSS